MVAISEIVLPYYQFNAVAAITLVAKTNGGNFLKALSVAIN